MFKDMYLEEETASAYADTNVLKNSDELTARVCAHERGRLSKKPFSSISNQQEAPSEIFTCIYRMQQAAKAANHTARETGYWEKVLAAQA